MVKYMDNNSGFAQWNANRNTTKQRGTLGGFIWWMILFIASWWLLSAWMAPKAPVVESDATTPVVVDVTDVPVHEISSDNITAHLRGLRVSNVNLMGHVASTESNELVSLLSADNNFIEVGFVATGTTAPTVNTTWKEISENTFNWKNSDGVNFTRNVTTDGYVITITDTIKNNSRGAISINPYARIIRTPDAGQTAGVYTGAVAYANSDIEHHDWKKIDKKSFAYTTTNGFIGFVDQYWETAVELNAPDQTMRVKKLADDLYSADTAAAAVSIAPGTEYTFTADVFVGPRDQSILNIAANKITGIDDTVDYGWFWFLAMPMAWILNVLNAFVGNYGLAIILFTLILRLLMWPLTRKSYTSMIAMQKMQPEMARIQKLYANDKMRLQMEMMRLYQTNKTSPMSGCLPMLIQIPVFFALYKALLVSVQMRSAHFLWISDLAAMDPYFILPILMGATMWLQQYLQSAATRGASNKNDAAAQTQRVMKWMPIVFTVMFAWMPAGLVLYWTVSNIFGIIQMQIIKHNSQK